jgi:hypothetical protein
LIFQQIAEETAAKCILNLKRALSFRQPAMPPAAIDAVRITAGPDEIRVPVCDSAPTGADHLEQGVVPKLPCGLS